MRYDSKELIGNVSDLSSLTEYQEGAIVSRMVVNKEAGTITAFAFDEGESLSEHSAPYDALAIIIEGKAKILIKGEEHIISDNQMIIMPANVPHAVESITKFKMLLVMIHA
ncbi:MAG TPA: cupin domain-containing protein [Methanocorpusculum sp.]|nr:cupin domain-containing protein [Methanocorpusculum sp.]